METLTLCEAIVEEESLDALLGVLALNVPFGWEESSLPTGQTRVRVHCGNAEFLQTLREKILSRVPGAEVSLSQVTLPDWTEAWKQFFTPVLCGARFVVLPPWLVDSTDTEGRWPIVIEPKSAFGTGHHPTTALCLTVLSDLVDSGRVRAGMRFLDLGTGSGILGLGCCRAGLTGLGTDIDVLAVDNTRENIRNNNVSGFTVQQGSVESVAGQTFDVVLANILARPLCEMAPQLVACVAQGGCLVLSGILEVQADRVEDTYTAQGLPAARRVIDGEWAALVWE